MTIIIIMTIMTLINIMTIMIMIMMARYGLSVPLSALSATEGRPLSLNFDFN